MSGKPVITGYKWVPPFAQGKVRDMRCRWAFEEVGIDYDVQLFELGENKSDACRVYQPFGQVPTYSDGTVEIFESGAIVLHIARQKPGLLPPDTAGEASAIAWIFSALNSVEPLIFDLLWVNVFDRKEAYADLFRPKATERLNSRLGELAKALGDKSWLVGDQFTAADLIMVSVLRQLENNDLLKEQSNLAAYVERGKARPAFQKALAGQMAVFAAATPPSWYKQGEKK
jgi:glutathione S-transferase